MYTCNHRQNFAIFHKLLKTTDWKLSFFNIPFLCNHYAFHQPHGLTIELSFVWFVMKNIAALLIGEYIQQILGSLSTPQRRWQ